jgi:hypothetical protein
MMDKSLSPMVIEIEDPEEVTIETEDFALTISEEEPEEDFDSNLAEYMDERELQFLASEIIRDIEEDETSRKEWIKTYVDGLNLLGLKYEERTEPWPGACGVFYPILSEAAVRFQSESIMEQFPAAGPVKTQIVGKVTPEKTSAADRVQEDMNWRLTEQMPEYRPEHEKLLWSLALAGSAFKKIYFDPSLGRQVAVFVPAEDIIVPYGISSLENSPRVTHVMRKTENDVKKLMASGFYRDVDLPEPQNVLDDVEKKKAEEMGMTATMDHRYKIYEVHVDLDLPGYEDKDSKGEPTGIALPYVVTLDKQSNTVLSIRRNYYEEDLLKLKRQHFVHYIYVPGFGFYGFGLIHLVGAFAKSGTSLIRQLVDAGTLSNLPGGLKTRGLRVKGDDTPISPGEFRDVDVPSGAIKDNILPLPYKEPSQVLFTLLQTIVQEGRRFAATADMQISDLSANTPVGTTLAVLERTLKVMSAVQARLHYSMRQEFKLLAAIIRDYSPEEYDYDVDSPYGRMIKQADYDMVDVIPVSDPNATTMAQRIVQYQAVLQLASQAPQIYDMPKLHARMLEVIGIKDVADLIPAAKEEKPQDPVSENMAVLNMKPVKAFMYQDHEAHMAVHMTAMQDPVLRATLGQNPQAQAMMGAMMAHINEHLGFLYRRQMEETLGVPLPPPGEPLPQSMEVELSRLVADASQQLLQKHMAQAQQQQAQQQQQDPIFQQQQMELQLKQGELQLKQQKTQADIQLRTQAEQNKDTRERERIEAQERIASAQIQAKLLEKAADAQRMP